MREGLTYISFISNNNGQVQEVLRGQLGAFTCLESQLQQNSTSAPFVDANGQPHSPYAFANAIVGAAGFAVRVQARPNPLLLPHRLLRRSGSAGSCM